MRCCLRGLVPVRLLAGPTHPGGANARRHQLGILFECTWLQATMICHEVLLPVT